MKAVSVGFILLFLPVLLLVWWNWSHGQTELLHVDWFGPAELPATDRQIIDSADEIEVIALEPSKIALLGKYSPNNFYGCKMKNGQDIKVSGRKTAVKVF